MRPVVLASILVVLAGCPASQHPGDDGVTADGGPTIDGAPPDALPACTNATPTCTETFTYYGTATTVELHGDFATDGWTTGVPMTKVGDHWEVTIPVADEQVIVYKLVVDGVWQSDPADARTSPDGYGGENSVVRVDCDHCPHPPPFDWRDAVLYFVMVDRFADGDTGNDHPLGLEHPADYQGGDLAGLTQKINDGYFNDLGINALWISSPLDNADGSGAGTDGHQYSAYHGYWPKDLSAIESHIGDEAALKTMIAAAHAHGLKVVLDYVMNHVHQESPIYAQHPDWFWPDDNGAGGNCICGDGCSWDDPVQRKRCWFTSYLPDFNFTNGDARRYSVGNAMDWAKTLGVDGFRLDAVKHVEDSWLTDLRARLVGEVQDAGPFYLVGETYTGDQSLIKYYVDPSTMLDGQFDFPMRAQVLSTLLRRDGQMSDLVGFLDANASYYGPGAIMSTFLGNHDVPRSIHLAEDTPLWGPWDGGKERAWVNQPQLPTSANPFQRVAVAYTLLMTTPGVPLIYYGDEYGMPGAGDPDNRRFMQWSGYTANQTWLHDQIAGLAKARAAHPALRRGTRTSLGTSTNVYTYDMNGGGDDVVVVLNRGDVSAPAVGLPDGTYRDLVNGGTVTAPLTVNARTGLVLSRQ